ncbi:hypothetical protein CDD80_6107 [Ophiocordyceps camponoti-rufipedis]|uniref:Uncharacterized protein n=1 Tax=Ophiocordyceps camponoti-rufipedis TaxID=2004952 RepID=A0A2C5XWQ4_9HYPO|nr:hypothetical protein CDD80_6107 [Ophiocordyceps camponoti-rufipedis]
MHIPLILSLSALALAAQQPSKRAVKAPLLTTEGSEAIPGQYLVILKANTDASIRDEIISKLSNKADLIYESPMNGFAGKMEEHELEVVLNNEHVDYVSQDQVSSTAAILNLKLRGQEDWGLSRISHREMPRKPFYNLDESAGKGTCVYVLDTGIQDTHPVFGSRAEQIASFVKNETTDGNGHGTHVAGIVGGYGCGVAYQTQLFGIKILDDEGRGTLSQYLAGLNLINNDMHTRDCPKGFVVNYSAIMRSNRIVNDAFNHIIAQGAFVAVAAGNDGKDARMNSPASGTTACVVGAISDDMMLLHTATETASSWGPRVDVFAPGHEISSAWLGDTYRLQSGTSVAAPYVAGLAAYLGALEGISGNEALCSRIKELSTKDQIIRIPAGTPNRIAYNGIEEPSKADEGGIPAGLKDKLSSIRPSRNAGTCHFYLMNKCQGTDMFKGRYSEKGSTFDGPESHGLEIFNNKIRSFKCDGKLVRHRAHTTEHWAWSTETQETICTHLEALYVNLRLGPGRGQGTNDKIMLEFTGQPGNWHTIGENIAGGFDQWQQMDLSDMFHSPVVEVSRLRELRVNSIKTSWWGGDLWGLEGIDLKGRCAGNRILVDNKAFQFIKTEMTPSRPQGYVAGGYVAWRGITNPDDWKSRVPCSHLRLLNVQIRTADEYWAGTSNKIFVQVGGHNALVADSVFLNEQKSVTIDPVVAFDSALISVHDLTHITFSVSDGYSDEVKLESEPPPLLSCRRCGIR